MFEQKTVKIKMYMETELTAALAADTDVVSVASFMPYAPTSGSIDKWYPLVCKMTYSNTNTKYTPSWKIYDHTSAMISDAVKDLDIAGQLGTTTKLTVAGAATANGTKVTAQPAAPSPAEAGYTLVWGVNDTWAEFDATKKIFKC